MDILQNVDPLILDLDDDGVELISFDDSNVTFDVDDDGFKKNTGWVKGSEGVLVEDKNGDGVINDISETISEYYTDGVANGLEALKVLDSNDDNLFNDEDAKWNDLRVWVDHKLELESCGLRIKSYIESAKRNKLKNSQLLLQNNNSNFILREYFL